MTIFKYKEREVKLSFNFSSSLFSTFWFTSSTNDQTSVLEGVMWKGF